MAKECQELKDPSWSAPVMFFREGAVFACRCEELVKVPMNFINPDAPPQDR
jgi:hypothetical protein